jgi:hypothetical protein
MLETPIGRGLFLTASLPASVEISDFALRSGFLALADHVLAHASRRSGPPRSHAGSAWLFARDSTVEIEAPTARCRFASSNRRATARRRRKSSRYETRGRYRVRDAGVEAFASSPSKWIISLATARRRRGGRDGQRHAARHASTLRGNRAALLVLISIELAVRVMGRPGGAGDRRGPAAAP